MSEGQKIDRSNSGRAASGYSELGVERRDLRIDGNGGNDGNDEREDAMGRGEAHGVSGSG